METLLNIILITVTVTLIIDVSGFADTIRRFFTALGKRTPKLFVCSLCLSFWCQMIYLVITNSLNLFYIAYALVLSNLTPIIKGLWELVFDALNFVIVWASRRINN